MEQLKRELKKLHEWQFEKEEKPGLEKKTEKIFVSHDLPKLHFRIPLEEIVKKVAENALEEAKTKERLEAKQLANKARKYAHAKIMENLEENENARGELLDEIHRQMLPIAEEYCKRIMEAKKEQGVRTVQIQLEDILEGKKRHVKLEIGVPKTPKDG